MSKSTREQVKELRLVHPNWAKADIARATVPPVSPQRIGQIENGMGNHFKTVGYKERNRHKYHKKIGKKFLNCKYCKLTT